MTSDAVSKAIDRISAAVTAFTEQPVEPEDADRVARRLRQINRDLWRQINSVEAMVPVDLIRVQDEMDLVGFGELVEAGVLRVDRGKWYRWQNQGRR